MWNLKYEWTYLQNRNRLTNIENKHGYLKKVGGGYKFGGWEFKAFFGGPGSFKTSGPGIFFFSFQFD